MAAKNDQIEMLRELKSLKVDFHATDNILKFANDALSK